MAYNSKFLSSGKYKISRPETNVTNTAEKTYKSNFFNSGKYSVPDRVEVEPFSPAQFQAPASPTTPSVKPSTNTTATGTAPVTTPSATGKRYTYDEASAIVHSYNDDFTNLTNKYGAKQVNGTWTFTSQEGLAAASELNDRYNQAWDVYDYYTNTAEGLRERAEEARKDADAAQDKWKTQGYVGRVDGTMMANHAAAGQYYGGEDPITQKQVNELKLAADTLAIQAANARDAEGLANLSKDKAGSELYDGAKTTYDDMVKVSQMINEYFAGMYGTYVSGTDHTKLEGYKSYLMEKYGLDASAFQLGPDVAQKGSLSLHQLYAQLEQQLNEQKAQLKQKGYNFETMTAYEQTLADKAEAEKKKAEQVAYAQEHPFAASAATIPAAMIQGGDFVSSFVQNIGHNDVRDLDNYIPMNTYDWDVTNMVTTIREAVPEHLSRNIDSEFGKNAVNFLYNTGMSIADSAVQVGTFGTFATYLMGASAAAQQSKQIIDDGGTNSQAFWGGLAAGAAEAVFERMSIEQLLKPKSVSGFRDILKETAKQAGVEASEEVFTELANIMSDAAIRGNGSQFNQLVAYYQSEAGGGLDPETARRRAYLDTIGQVALAGLGGALSGGFMAGGRTTAIGVYNKAVDTEVGKQIVGGVKGEDGKLQNHIDLVEKGLTYAEGSQTHKLASKLHAILNDARVDATTAVSASEWGKLQRVMQDELKQYGPQTKASTTARTATEATAQAEQAQKEVVQALNPDAKVMSATAQLFIDAGVSATEADTRADILDRIAAGDTTLSNSKIKDLNFHDAATRAVYEQVVGQALPSTTANKDLIAAVRSHIAAINERQAKDEQLARAEQGLARTMEAMMQSRALQAEANQLETKANQLETQAAEPTAEPVNAQTSEAGTVKLSNGEELTQAQFVQQYQDAQGVDAAEAQRVFAIAQEANGFGQAYPASNLTAQTGTIRHSVGTRAEPVSTQPVEAGEDNSPQTTADTKSEIEPAEGEKTAPVLADEATLSDTQKTTRKVLRDALGLSKASSRKSASVIRGVEYVRRGSEADEAFYDGGTQTLYINADRMTTGGEIMSVIAHELTHAAETKDKGIVAALLKFAQDTFGLDVKQAVAEKTEEYKEFFAKRGKSEAYIAANTTRELMEGEVAAEVMRWYVFPNAATLNILGRENRKLLQRLRDGVERVVSRLVFGDTTTDVQSECERLVERLNSALKNTENESKMDTNKEVRSSAGEENRENSGGVRGDHGQAQRGVEAENSVQPEHHAGGEGKEHTVHGDVPVLDDTQRRGLTKLYDWERASVVQPTTGSPAEKAVRIAQSYGLPVFVLRDADMRAHGKKTAYSGKGVVFLSDALSVAFETEAAVHEVVHTMAQTKFDPYKALLRDTDKNLRYGEDLDGALAAIIAHVGLSGSYWDMSIYDQLDVLDELAAVLWGGYAQHGQDAMWAIESVLEDPDQFVRGMTDIIEQYRNKNLNKANEGTPATGEDAFSNARRSIGRRDAEYMAAVENGDMEIAQRMVDEAAKAAGYTNLGYHGTEYPGFTSFNPNLWLARDKAVARGYGRYREPAVHDAKKPHDAKGVYALYYRLGNNLHIDAEGSDWSALPVSEEDYPGVYVDRDFDSNDYGEGYGEISTNAMAEWAMANGYDSITFKDVEDGGFTTVDVVFNPKRDAKSADPITYDDNGDVIPLSERFNDESPDIRYSLARTDTEAFRNWFHDDTGELTNPDGTPKVFLRGSTFSGGTSFRTGADNHSGGIFFSTDEETAGFYAHQKDDEFSMEAPEFMPKVYKSWHEAFEATQDGELGNNVAVELAGPHEWELAVRRRTEKGVRWETLETFPDTAEGLKRFNDQYGQLIRDASVVNPAYMRCYLSAQKTKVIDAEGRTWDDVDSAGLRTNDIARQAWQDGYDMVIVKNVQDGAPTAMEFDALDNFKMVAKTIDVYIAKDSTQVKSVYNTGGFDATNPDVRYSAGRIPTEAEPILGRLVAIGEAKSLKSARNKLAYAMPNDLNRFVRRYMSSSVFTDEDRELIRNLPAFLSSEQKAANIDRGYKRLAKAISEDLSADEAIQRYSAGRANREYAPTFYSKMEQEINAFKQAKMGASSVVAYLKGHGVKDEEIKWSGIEQWLEGKKSVTKEELLEFAKLNAIELEEQVLDGHREVTELQDETTGEIYTDLEHMREVAYAMAEGQGYSRDDVLFDYNQYPYEGLINVTIFDDGDEIDLTRVQATFADKDPQWEDYTTPGGDNYRELLYKMPGSEYTNRAMSVHWGRGDAGKGVLAHARVQDFETADGTMLFIDEIQSDWHNAGAKEGYQHKDTQAMLDELRDIRMAQALGLKDENDQKREAELEAKLYPKRAALDARREALLSRLDEDGALASVVDKVAEAKYEGNRQYAKNRVISSRSSLDIAELDALAGGLFTDEEVNALLRFIEDKQDWDADNTQYAMEGGREAETNRAPEAPYSKNYHEYVLKRLIREAAEMGYDSIGWTTGKMQEERWSSEYAEGYRIEYDQDMPKFLNKYGKQWGAKVEKGNLPSAVTDTAYLSGRVEIAREGVDLWQQELADAETDSRIEFCQERIDSYQRMVDFWESKLMGPEIWKMKLTDAMREDVLYKGQPRYSAGKKGYNPNLNYPSWREQVDAYQNRKLDDLLRKNGDRASVLYVSAEPTPLLKKLGLSDLPLIVTRSHMRQILGKRWDEDGKVIDEHNHELSEDVVKLLPQLLQHPVMVLKSDPNITKGGVEIVTNLTDAHGDPIVITIKPDQPNYTYDGVDGPAHFVNVFGRANFDERLEKAFANNQVLYVNKERANSAQFGASNARHERTYGISSDAIIQQKDPTVKPSARRFSAGKKGTTKTGGNTGNINPETGYEAGSVADSFMRILNTGDRQGALDALEEAARMLAEAKAQRAEQQKQETLSQVFRPKLTEDAIERNERVINELIAKYGKMEQTSAAQQEVNFPKQIDDKTKVRGFMQTAAASKAATEDLRNTLADDIVNGRVGATYQPVTDRATMDKLQEQFKTKTGFEAALREWRAKVDSGTMPGKEDIAKGEALFVQACAEGQTFEAQKLASEIAIMGTQLGQAVQAMSLVKRMTPAGQLYYIQKTVDRLNAEKAQQKRNVRLVIDEKLAAQLLAAKNKEELDAAIEAITQSLADQMPVTIYDKWNTWRYLSMLGNPRTHIRNLAGNAIFVPARLIKDVAAMGMERMVIKDKSQRTKGIADADLRAFAKQDADLMGDELRDGGKYDTKDLIRDKRRIYKLGALNWAAKTNSTLLEKEDWIFLKSAYANALGGYLAAQGYTAEQVYGSNSTPEGRAALDRARVYAVEEAKKATYRDASKLAQWMNHSARNMGPVGSVIWGGLMPFTKTPINIVKRGIEYSPVGLATTLVKGAAQLRNGKMTAAKFIDGIAAGLTGSAVCALGYFLAKAGLLVGALGDDDEDKFEQLQGNQEYSIRLGDQSYTIDWMSPVVLPLFVGEAVHKFSENEGVDGWEVLEAAAGLLDPIMSLSMLDGLNQTLSSIKYDSGEPIPAILQSIVGSYVSQGVPTVLGSVARTIDDSRRTSFTPSGQTSVQRWLSRLWQTSFLGKTPIAAEERMAYVDEWGRTDTESSVLMRAIENFVSPGYINPLQETPLESEIDRLAKATGDNAVYPNKAEKSFSVGGETYAMSQDEYQEHLLYRGQTSWALASDITTSRTYADLDDATRAKALDLAYDYAAALAKVNTNSAYAADKWVLKLAEFEEQGGDVAEYLLLRAQSRTTDKSLTDMVLTNSAVSAKDAAEILVMERTMPTVFTDPYAKGYEYVMDDEAQAKYAQMYHDQYLNAYFELVQDDEFREGTLAERKKLVSALGTEVNDQVKRDMADWYWDRDIDSTEKS